MSPACRDLAIRLAWLFFACLAAAVARAEEASDLTYELFEKPSASESGGLRRVSEEESGLYLSSKYEDPRAWRERLEPATIGTVGTGIGVGDFNSDGYPDLFVAMREGRNRLYLNEGGSSFRDATEEAGILESLDWTTGVTVMDLNGDALPDIYVCFYKTANRMYLNRGDGSFEEAAEKLGLAIADASSGAFFADYDRDGDLDLYLQTNTIEGNGGGGQLDYLLRNDGASGFKDVSREAGLLLGEEGRTLGHSALWMDFDSDGWEDLYVANDFRAPDFLYLNNGDGSFRVGNREVPVAPYSSMGSDLGDVNGDGLLDALTTDMASPSYGKHVASMLTSAVKTRDLPSGSRPTQMMKNALLLNRGLGDYVDVAYSWGLAATDWTWAARLIDLDNDGWQDALFTNGMIRQFHNADLALEQDKQQSSMGKTAVFKRSPVLNEENKVYRNIEGSGFEEANASWNFGHLGVSFGVATLDMDRDGDLDFVYTNYEAPPTLWLNEMGGGNSVQVVLRGVGENRDAIGASAVAFYEGGRQAAKLLSNRGYLGSDEKMFHFGLGERRGIERLQITWPSGEQSAYEKLEGGRRYYIEYGEDAKGSGVGLAKAREPRLEQIESQGGELAKPVAKVAPARAGALYPFKALPVAKASRLFRSDFNNDEKMDTFILGDWSPPRLILSGSKGMQEASEDWGLANLNGLWEVALLGDFNGDGFEDVFLGGMGTNNEISYRGQGSGTLLRSQGRFSENGPLVNLNAYDWGGELRLYDSLRDYAELDPRVSDEIASFRESGEMDYEDFVERTGFTENETYRIDRFESGMLMNQGGKGFQFVPLSLEAQYGRVWDAATADLDGDGDLDLCLLLGQVSPHYRSSQSEGSFVSLFWGEGDGSFSADSRPPLPTKLPSNAVALSIEESEGELPRLRIQLESGGVLVFRVTGR